MILNTSSSESELTLDTEAPGDGSIKNNINVIFSSKLSFNAESRTLKFLYKVETLK